MRLDAAQVEHFRTFGYLALPALFAADEIGWITAEFERAIQSEGGGAAHDGTRRTMFGGPIERTDRLCTILDDARITGLLSGLLGPEFNYCGGDGNYYTGDTPWHPDGNWGEPEPFAIKVAFYLDALTTETGCLRVLPGSHDPQHLVRQLRLDPNRASEQFGVEPRQFPGVTALETVPGDIVVFNHDTYHSAWGGGNRRRMFTMNCIRGCSTEHDLDLARRYLSVHSPGGYKVETGGGMYFPRMLDTAGPERMVHLWQPQEIHDALFPQYARKR